MNWPKIEEIIYSECDNPHALLGAHKSGTHTLVQAYFPEAKKVSICWTDEVTKEAKETKMELADEDGYFAALFSEKKLPAYRYRVTCADGTE